MPFEPHQRRARLVRGARLARLGLRDPRLGDFGLRPQPPRVPSDVAGGVALVDQAAGGLVAIAQRRRQQFGAVASGRAARDAFKSLQQPGPFRLVSGLDADRLDLRPVLLEIFAEHVLLLVVEIGEEQREEIAGAVLERPRRGSHRNRDHRLEQMHLRVLPPRHRRRQSFQERRHAASADCRPGRRAARRSRRGSARPGRAHRRSPAPAARRRDHRYRAADPARRRRRQAMHEAGPAVGRLRLGQQIVQPLQRDGAAFGVPAHLRRLGVAIDLAGLHEHPPRREAIGAAVRMQPVDKAARRRRPSLRSTTAAGRGRSCGASACATISPAGLAPPRGCCSSAIAFPETSPIPISGRLIPRQRRRAIGPNLQDQP